MSSSLLRIEKGVPLPPSRNDRSGTPWPFGEMEVGDSFFVTNVTVARLLVAARRFTPKRFTTRRMTESGVSGIRVWRVG